ncbi:flavodoxin family protein [Nocardioides bruguierae]|uniref:Flavodoxin-like domain-containing protein n=1 Tax=Nocardioides bruguierae TaxID=2945102 RepID=A0A9X2IDU1_9ACTN|nr:hypothetical protein [Nocardioides bruguierae]MCM0619388.1 hypothetical protein [Nocardioides bruguierae]
MEPSHRRTERCLVAHESLFGNTRLVAEAVAAGIEESGIDTRVADVRDPRTGHPGPGTDLVVLAAPTHAFSLSRPDSRSDALRRGATGTPERGLREWLCRWLEEGGPTRPCVAVLDTRVTRVRRLPGASGRIARLLRAQGYRVLDEPTTFLVRDVEGPLVDGEVERAREWGHRLAEELTPAGAGPAGTRT